MLDGRRFSLSFALGGDEEDRTPDPLLARQVLSQLSYTPISERRVESNLSAVLPSAFGRAEDNSSHFPLFEGTSPCGGLRLPN